MKLLSWRRYTVVLACASFSAFAQEQEIPDSNANPEQQPEVQAVSSALWGAVQTIAAHVAQTEGIVSSAEMERLAAVLSASDFNTANPNPVHELARTLLDASLNIERLAIDELVPKVSSQLIGFLANRDGDSGLDLGMLLFPYMDEAGLCERTAGQNEEEEGVLCQFTFGTPGSNIAAVSGLENIPQVDTSSLLGQILSAALPGGDIGTAASGGDGDGEGTENYSYLGIPLSARYAYYYAWQYNCGSSCRASAAGYGAIKATYAAVGADSVFAAAGAALYCGWTCLLEAGWDFVTGEDLITSVLDRGDKRYQEIHSPAKAVHAIIPTCGTAPASYLTSPAHLLLENTDIELPYDVGVDIKFGTYFQKANESGTGPALFPNLDPGPPTRTHYKILNTGIAPLTGPLGQILGNLGAQLAVLGYEYEFTQLQSWSFDIIFAAALSATSATPTACYARVPASLFGMGAGYAFGDTLWFYQGFAKSGEDYDLPTVSVGIGF